jgi:sugar lactone lactonase YvrE
MNLIKRTLEHLILLLTLLVISCVSHASTVGTVATLPTDQNDGTAIDSLGNIYVSNTGQFSNGRGTGETVFKIAPDGTVSTHVTIASPGGLSVDADDNLYIAGIIDNTNRDIFKVTPEGVISRFSNSQGVINWNSQGEAFAVEYNASTVYQVDEEGGFSVFSRDPLINGPTSIVFDENDDMYIGNFNNGGVIKINDDGTGEAIGFVPGGMGYMTYMSGKFYATGFNNNQVFSITKSGEVAVLAGTGTLGETDGDGENATFSRPNGIAAMPDGVTLIVSEYGVGARKIRSIVIDSDQVIVNIANDNMISVDEDESITFSPAENDDGFPSLINVSSISIVQAAENGTTQIDSATGSITYQGNPNYFGDDSISYTIQNESGNTSNEASIFITVLPIVDEPIAQNDTASTNVNEAVNIAVLENDEDLDLVSLRYSDISIVTTPTNGELVVGDAAITYTPSTDFTGQDSFSYSVANAAGLASAAADVSVTVNAVAQTPPPTAAPAPEASSSGGGSVNWFLLLLGVCVLASKYRTY